MNKKKITKKSTVKAKNKTKKSTVKAKKTTEKSVKLSKKQMEVVKKEIKNGYKVILHIKIEPDRTNLEYQLLHDFLLNKFQVYSHVPGEKFWKFEYENRSMARAYGRILGKALKNIPVL